MFRLVFTNNLLDMFYLIPFTSYVYFSDEYIDSCNMSFELLKILVTSCQNNCLDFWMFSEFDKKWYHILKELIRHTCSDKKLFWISNSIFLQEFRIDQDIIRSSSIFFIHLRCL